MEPVKRHSHIDKADLRMVLLINAVRQPRWVCRAIEAIQLSGLARIVLIVRPGPARQPAAGLLLRVRQYLAHLGTLGYSTIDDWFFRRETDALTPASIEPMLPGVEVMEIEPERSPGGEVVRESDLQAIQARRLDLALAFGFRLGGNVSRRIARLGTWSYRMEPSDPCCAGPPGFWEVLQGRSLTESTLESECGGGGPRVLYRSFSATDPFSVRRNRDHACSKAATFVVRALRDLSNRGLPPPGDGSDDRPPADTAGAARCPGNLEMLRFGVRLADKFARDRLWRLCFDEQWGLAFSLDRPRPPAGGLALLRPPRDHSWADPFPMRRGDDFYIFVEEVPKRTRKGHISVIEMDRRGSWKPPVKVLERDYHLAYPFVFEWEGAVFMIPETSANRTIELYRCSDFPLNWTLEKVLLRDLRASDATLHEIDGRWWMFVNVAPAGARNTWDELHLYQADSPMGPWHPHPRNPVKSDVRSSRPAGRLIREHDGLYRPAQDCSRRYGHSIVLHKVTRIDPEHYAETAVSRILPDWDRSLLATHTYNRAANLTVLDCLLRRPRLL